jgi:hypothetical protein
MNWKRLLTYITGTADQELLLRNEYLVTENRILSNQIKGRLRLTDPEPINLAEIGRRPGRKSALLPSRVVWYTAGSLDHPRSQRPELPAPGRQTPTGSEGPLLTPPVERGAAGGASCGLAAAPGSF